MATLPIAIGMIAEVMLCFFSASCSSTAASTSATATRATKAGLKYTRLSTTYAPSPTPMPMAAGKLRPARPCACAGAAGGSVNTRPQAVQLPCA